MLDLQPPLLHNSLIPHSFSCSSLSTGVYPLISKQGFLSLHFVFIVLVVSTMGSVLVILWNGVFQVALMRLFPCDLVSGVGVAGSTARVFSDGGRVFVGGRFDGFNWEGVACDQSCGTVGA